MGILSVPILVICYDNDGKVISEEIKMHIDDETIKSYFNDGMLGMVEKNDIIVKPSIMSIGEVKVWGYLGSDEVKQWSKYFDILLDQNLSVYEVQVHFFCVDNQFPYVIRKKREDKLEMYVGNENNILYTDINESDDEDPFYFNNEKYKDVVLSKSKLFWSQMKKCHIG
jgi:hypothetical protein